MTQDTTRAAFDAQIELPPLPSPGEAMSKWAYDEADMKDYARQAIAHDRQQRGEPVAWAAFADNGSIRIWSAKRDEAKRLEVQIGQPLQPLYANPQPAEPQRGGPAGPAFDEDGLQLAKEIRVMFRSEDLTHWGDEHSSFVLDAIGHYTAAPQPAEPVKHHAATSQIPTWAEIGAMDAAEPTET